MNSAPISTTAPLSSRRDQTRPPTRSRASSTVTSAPARLQLVRRAPGRPAPRPRRRPSRRGPLRQRRPPRSRRRSWTITGFSSISRARRPAPARRRAAARPPPRPHVERRAPAAAGEQRRRAQRRIAALDALRGRPAAARSRRRRAARSRSRPAATTSAGTTRVGARRHEQLGARRAPSARPARRAVDGAAPVEPPVGGAHVVLGAQVERQPADVRLVQQPSADSLSATGPPSSRQRRHGVVLVAHEPALDDRQAAPRAAGAWPRARRASRRAVAGRRATRPAAAPISRRRAGSPARPAERGHAGQPGAQARHRRDAGRGEARGGLVVEQLGQGGGDHDRHLARRARPARIPSRTARPDSLGGAVDARPAGRRARARWSTPGRRRWSRRCRAGSRPRPRSARCSRAGCRPSPPTGSSSRRRSPVVGASARQRDAPALALVGGQRRVAARAGQHGEPAAARPGARPARPAPSPARAARGRPGPGRARLLDEGAEHALVARDGAGVRAAAAAARRPTRPP